jgi:hypothetical protein
VRRAVLILALAVCACSGNDATGDTMTPLITTTTTTTLPPTTLRPTTLPATTTTSTTSTTTSTTSTTTSTSTTTTTTTIPRSVELVLRQDGLGDASFGVDVEEVIDYIRSIVGAPTSDSGWADPFSAFGVCPGTEVRGVTWGDLLVLFSDESLVATGRRHFFSYTYGPAFIDGTPRPPAMRTPEGITVGSTVAELRAAYPEVVVTPGDEIFGPSFHVNDNLNGFLTGDTDADTVEAIIGGVGCGE